MWVVRALMLGLLVASVGCGGSDAEDARTTIRQPGHVDDCGGGVWRGGCRSRHAPRQLTEPSSMPCSSATERQVSSSATSLGATTVPGFRLRRTRRAQHERARDQFRQRFPDEDMVAGPRSCSAAVPSGSSCRRSMGGTAALVAQQRRSMLPASLRCQRHRSSAALTLSLLCVASRPERSFSPDDKTRASLATRVGCTERWSSPRRVWS